MTLRFRLSSSAPLITCVLAVFLAGGTKSETQDNDPTLRCAQLLNTAGGPDSLGQSFVNIIPGGGSAPDIKKPDSYRRYRCKVQTPFAQVEARLTGSFVIGPAAVGQPASHGNPGYVVLAMQFEDQGSSPAILSECYNPKGRPCSLVQGLPTKFLIPSPFPNRIQKNGYQIPAVAPDRSWILQEQSSNKAIGYADFNREVILDIFVIQAGHDTNVANQAQQLISAGDDARLEIHENDGSLIDSFLSSAVQVLDPLPDPPNGSYLRSCGASASAPGQITVNCPGGNNPQTLLVKNCDTSQDIVNRYGRVTCQSVQGSWGLNNVVARGSYANSCWNMSVTVDPKTSHHILIADCDNGSGGTFAGQTFAHNIWDLEKQCSLNKDIANRGAFLSCE